MSCFISASIIAADFLCLEQEIARVTEAGVDGIHLDIMDGHYVPNLSVGPMVVESIARACTIPMDAHLMVSNPQAYIEPLARLGVRMITVHPETCDHLDETIAHIQSHGMQVGFAFNPDQSPLDYASYLSHVDFVLIMSVFPGFCGQAWIEDTLAITQALVQWLKENHLSVLVGMDGGIKPDNIARCHQAGAGFVVMGSGIFGADDYTQRLKHIRQALD